MVLRREEARVLACLIEKDVEEPDGYPVGLNALRLACNQTTDRWPLVTYDDRTVEGALFSLKSMGLVRFVEPADDRKVARYRHAGDERWRLSKSELAVLAVLVLRGPQTVEEVEARLGPLDAAGGTVEDILDTLTARSPEPFATRLPPRRYEQNTRFAHLLSGEVEDNGARPPERRADAASADGDAGADAPVDVRAVDLQSLRELVDRARITDLIHRYSRAVDRLDADLLRSVYWPDGTDDHGVFAGNAMAYVDWVMDFVGGWISTHHDNSNIMIDLDGDVAYGECHWTGWYRFRQGDQIVDQVSNGRYLDRYERRDGEWRIFHRVCVSDWNRSAPRDADDRDHRLRGRRGTDDLVYQLRELKLGSS
jgi:uncharacterized protein YceH (UPF0502 family)